MTRIRDASPLGRLWSAVIAASAAAVEIHYAAPWSRTTSRRA
ncbi:MAG TPA: hypothetical protein VN047_03680 [Sphingopyxis sp.]|nr:hypothetical protein [Sphingopyxis sp.]HWW55975.1 hypothetical protein [Sphingopyxis sp.]